MRTKLTLAVLALALAAAAPDCLTEDLPDYFG